ncbi:diguanylate cyclase [Selenomonas sp. oral taxon 126]|nr:diguanylate cyclase [Selenomonas sp. oral taxon 126]
MGTWTKKVMFVGLPRYFEQLLAACFRKEAWEVSRMASGEENAPQGIQTYDCAVDSEEAKTVFAVQNLDLLVYRLERDPACATSRLDALLRLAIGAQVRRIFLLSNDEVFAPGTQPVETDAPAPQTEMGRLLARLESIGLTYRAQGAPVSILRFPELYAPGQTSDDGFIGRLFGAPLMRRPLPHYPNAEAVSCGLLDARDAVFALYQAAARDFSEAHLHIAAPHGTTMAELYQICSDFFPCMDEQGEPREPNGRAVMRSAVIEEQLGWRSRRPLAPGLRETYEAMEASRDAYVSDIRAFSRRAWLGRILLQIIPYAENLAGALVTAGISYLQGGSSVNSMTAFDFAFIYIGCMGLLYGKQQALIAALFSLILLIHNLLGAGGDLVAMLYNPREFLHFVSYFFAAVLTGYFADRASYQQLSDSRIKRRLQYRYSFLEKIFKENLAVKDRLYRQIVNSDDSIGRLYRIVSRLDSVETENLYTQTAAVTADILSVKDVVVYIVGEGGYYLRQKVRLGSHTHELPRSVRVEDNPYLVQMLDEKKIFVNRDLIKGLPDLAAPISYDGRVIAVLQIYNLDFEQWSLYEQNLLSITARLVSSSLGRAYEWDKETAGRKYLDGTRILRTEEFEKVIEEFRERRRMQPNYPVTLLAIDVQGRSYSELDHQIANSIRGEDFIGVTPKGVSLLLPDVAGKTLDMVRERLMKVGIATGESQAL